MPGRTGALAGWSDRPEPGWQERAIARVNARQAQSNTVRQSRRAASIQIYYDPPFARLLDAAARQRDLAIGSYTRRAVAKQIAKDLGMDWTEVLKHCARPSPYGSKPWGRTPKGEKTIDTGEGHGDWSN